MQQKEPLHRLALRALQSKLDTQSTLDIINEGGYCTKAHFVFHPPATDAELLYLKSQLSLPLSPAYEAFLHDTNGARLYYDNVYGQWGFLLYGTTEMAQKNKKFQGLYEDDSLSRYLLFAESFGDADVLAFDTAQSIRNSNDFPVIDGDSDSFFQEWSVITSNFGDWLDRLIVAQGAKYWRWF